VSGTDRGHHVGSQWPLAERIPDEVKGGRLPAERTPKVAGRDLKVLAENERGPGPTGAYPLWVPDRPNSMCPM
jgi:hypothetical protein